MGSRNKAAGNRSASPAFSLGQQNRSLGPKGISDPRQTEDRDIPLPAFQAADVGPVQFRLSREVFLAPAELLAGRSDSLSQGDGKWSLSHARTLET